MSQKNFDQTNFYPGTDGVKPSEGNNSVDESMVWERFKNGDRAALTFIYQSYSNILYNYGCQFTSKPEMIKDSIQDLFIDLINQRENLSGTTSIKYYLFKCLRNKLVRSLTKANLFSDNGLDQQSQFEVSINPELIMINRQIDEHKKQLIAKKLNDLPPLQREAILLFYFEGLSYDQIANILGMKVKSARALIYRSIRSLGKLISPHRADLQD